MSRGLRVKPTTFRGESLQVREPAAMERLEFTAIASKQSQVDAIAYALRRHVLKPDGSYRFTAQEALDLAMVPAEEFGDVLDLITEINSMKGQEKKSSPPLSDSNTA